MEARQEVDRFLAFLRKNKENDRAPTDEEMTEMATPANVAGNLFQASGLVIAQKLPVPAIHELFAQNKFEEFVDVLFPMAPAGYREQVVIEMKKINGEIIEGVDDDDDGDGDGDDGDGDGDEGATTEDGSPSDNVHDGSPAPKKPRQRAAARA